VREGVLIPWFLMRVITASIRRDRAVPNVPASLLVCSLMVVGYRVAPVSRRRAGVSHHLIGVALSMLLIGLFLMVTRKKAITQILALLTVENAVFPWRLASPPACRSSSSWGLGST
jgi:hydrogenase-4 component E